MADIQSLKAELERELAEFREFKAQQMAPSVSSVSSGGIDAATLEAILGRTTKAAGQASEIIAGKLKPENADHRHLGPFEYPEGGVLRPKPALAREMYFGAFRLREGELPPVEIEALNALSASLTRSQRRTAHDGRWSAEVNDADTRLSITVPMATMDQRADLPSFLAIVLELTGGERALDLNDMAQELAALRTKVARMEGAAV